MTNPRSTLGLLAWMMFSPAALMAQAQSEMPPDGAGPYTPPPAAVEAISRLKSPYCPGFMLEVCSSTQGAMLRDSIADLAEAGWTVDELVEWVLANHGEEYRALPKGEGASLVAWLVPPAAGLLGLGVLLLALGRLRRRRAQAGPVPSGDVSTEDEERLRMALEKLELEEEAPFF